MSKLSMFMKQNKIQRQNAKYAATQSLLDEKGNPLEWEIKPLTTKESEEIRDACTENVPVEGKINMYRPTIKTSEYNAMLAAASVVYPNLYDSELQDSYGVKKPEKLIIEMLDNPGEYQEFILFIQKYNGFNVTVNDKVEEAKN